MMYWGSYGMGGWGVVLMAVDTVLFWVLVIVAVVALVRVLSCWPGRGDRERSNSEQLLAERFARDEIDEQAYRCDLETLRQVRHSTSGGS
ncbi:SHOCT domain-containing protein [Amycolatopsis sp. DSM 110486]|uniref:SHOCT domain-containing protein n=1 Tax=Amycolatopsis sp. DSM 110486 TaxID=2865832 RepID=UPI001C6A2D23|nr:SHOCT domain-containing protein [Amycolatopsis sp. DSM 110486]QYN20267.1 SHOCT domain-containing protein [Amycolatopsis sp. DSM 110486]